MKAFASTLESGIKFRMPKNFEPYHTEVSMRDKHMTNQHSLIPMLFFGSVGYDTPPPLLWLCPHHTCLPCSRAVILHRSSSIIYMQRCHAVPFEHYFHASTFHFVCYPCAIGVVYKVYYVFRFESLLFFLKFLNCYI